LTGAIVNGFPKANRRRVGRADPNGRQKQDDEYVQESAKHFRSPPSSQWSIHVAAIVFIS
jgi:hypothetical protein